jgi:alanine-glyoxylate transaminase / serine-glyoxylate transaminase / serine-pyruvate transaminase
MTAPPRLDPPARLLCGPGPANVDPRVLEAMQRPLLGHLDPDILPILEQIARMLSTVFGREGGLTLALQATGTAGMEAGVAALIEPRDTVVVGVAGYFGQRLVEIARRAGADVVEVGVPFGQAIPTERLAEALRRHPETQLLAVVHAETSVGVRQPVEELAEAARGSDALILVDQVTALGGIPSRADEWELDYCYSCSQKCLGAPPGLAPVSVSERGLERLRARRSPVAFTFDLELLARYWVERPPVYHHTAPILHLYALHEALRLALEEGLDARFARHAEVGRSFQAAIEERGLELLAEPGARLPQLTAVRVPDGVDGREIQQRLLHDHGIEVGGGLGPSFPPIWRVGLMGANATAETAGRVLAALDDVLGSTP